jgi:murein DD-endopeptidase MepM/ murein hydrolase activator NlpD
MRSFNTIRQITRAITISFIVLLPLPAGSQIDPATDWHFLYQKIRDRLISKEEAKARLKGLEPLLKEAYLKRGGKSPDDRLCFPLKGYDFRSMGGKGGSGYQAQGYDFFDGNEHKGHPAHDLFIRDKNQDSLDDLTGKPVEVISTSSGIVVSLHLDWEPSSPLRGGNYIWIYEPIRSHYYYYAHLGKIFVQVGQIVSKKDPMGVVGRTGVKAYPKRSASHLHFVVHESKEGHPKPVNPYPALVKGCLSIETKRSHATLTGVSTCGHLSRSIASPPPARRNLRDNWENVQALSSTPVFR